MTLELVLEMQYRTSEKWDFCSFLTSVTKLDHSFFTWYIGLHISNNNKKTTDEHKAIKEVTNSFGELFAVTPFTYACNPSNISPGGYDIFPNPWRVLVQIPEDILSIHLNFHSPNTNST